MARLIRQDVQVQHSLSNRFQHMWELQPSGRGSTCRCPHRDPGWQEHAIHSQELGAHCTDLEPGGSSVRLCSVHLEGGRQGPTQAPITLTSALAADQDQRALRVRPRRQAGLTKECSLLSSAGWKAAQQNRHRRFKYDN